MKLKKEKKGLRQGLKDKKEEKNMEAVVGNQKRERVLPRLFQGISFRAVSTVKKQDILLENATSEFERQLIRDCRADGMSDGEIGKWLKQL